MRRLISCVVLLLFWSCSDVVDDRDAPTIDRFDISNATVETGGALSVAVTVADNEELSQVRLRISDAFSKTFQAWEEQRIDFIGGDSYSRSYTFFLPDSALAGFYEASLQVIDSRGNVSPDSLQTFTVFRKGLSPQLLNFQTIPPIGSDRTIILLGGDTLIFNGVALDDTLLSEVEIEILSETSSSLERFTYNLSADSIQSWDFGVNSDSLFTDLLSSPPATLVIRVTDAQGHLLREEYPILFSE